MCVLQMQPMCCRGARHRLPLEEAVQQGPDAAEPLQAALLGGTTSPSRFRQKMPLISNVS